MIQRDASTSCFKAQPEDGATILHCGHLGQSNDAPYPAHWFRYETVVRFERPDGTCGEAEWFVICASCLGNLKCGARVPVRGDGQWLLEKVKN